MAQEHHKYKVHIEGKNGQIVNKVYASLDELKNDPKLRDLEIGHEENGEFRFVPDENKHVLYAVERLGGDEKVFIFQTWGKHQENGDTVMVEPPAAPEPEVVVNNKTDRSSIEKPHKEDNIISPPESAKFPKVLNDDILNALIQDGLIDNKNQVSIEFTDGLLKINGRQQSDSIAKKYRKLLTQSGITFDDQFVYEVKD